MNEHISDDDLILTHYGELPDVDRHLDGCDPCRARLETLRRVLAAIDDESIPEPRADYEEHVWRQVSWRLRPSRRRVWLSIAAAVALVILGFAVGRMRWGRGVEPMPAGLIVATQTPPTPQIVTPDQRLAFAADSHLDRSSRLLLDVANGETDFDAGELVASNRLYRVMAERAGASDVARLLDELEPILLELQHGGDPAAIRKRIEERDLLFKLRVIRSRAGDKPQAVRPSSVPKGIDS